MPDARVFVKRSRKEIDKLPVRDWARDAIIAAAEWTTMLAPDYLHGLIQKQLSLCGKTAASLVVDGDKPILFVPAWIANEGGDQPGVVLTTTTGAIFAWTEGRLRLSYFGLAIPYTVVRDIATPAAPPDYNASLRVVSGDETLTAHFSSVRNADGPTGFLDAIVASLSGEGSNATGKALKS